LAAQDDALRIVEDGPGRLVLGRPAPPFPGAVVTALAAAILLCLALGWFWRGFLLVAMLLFGALCALVSSRMNVVTRLAFDASAGRIEITRVGVVGEDPPIVQPIPALGGLRLYARLAPPAPEPEPARLQIRFAHRSGFLTRTLFVCVAGVTTLAEAGDLGRRLAAATGFAHERTTATTTGARELRLEWSAEPPA
jgi:hypothetical protein